MLKATKKKLDESDLRLNSTTQKVKDANEYLREALRKTRAKTVLDRGPREA